MSGKSNTASKLRAKAWKRATKTKVPQVFGACLVCLAVFGVRSCGQDSPGIEPAAEVVDSFDPYPPTSANPWPVSIQPGMTATTGAHDR